MNTLFSSSSRIWSSRISWRIALVAFMTIWTIQIFVLILSAKNYEARELDNLRNTGRSAIASLIKTEIETLLSSPFSEKQVDRLLSTTIVKGFAVYSLQYDLLQTYGHPVTITIRDAGQLSQTYRSPDKNSYEVVLTSLNLARPYLVAVRLDSSSVQDLVGAHIRETIFIMFLLSAFVTVVLMAALGRWLLEPILFLRSNLVAASRNPENPDIKASPFDPSDEIGGAIDLASSLIHQNAANLKQMKEAAEDKIHRLAYYDTLTKLPNRTLFLQKLSEKTRVSEGDGASRFAVLAVDLDHFKDVNDSMGHNVGDAILRGVGKRLVSVISEASMVSRTGEDEFAVTVELTQNGVSAREIGQQVLEAVRSEPFRVFNEQFQISASVGISIFPDDALDPDQVLKNADIALNRAKEEGRNRIKEYSEDFDRDVQQRFQILRDLRDALEQKQLQLHYQPQLDLRSQRIVGVEALLRWWKPDNSKQGGRFISPVEFISVAEQSGLMVPIGNWVVEEACRTVAGWHREHGYNGRIAINVSAVQFTQSDIVQTVRSVIEHTGIDPRAVELEVTESVFMENVDNTVALLNELHTLGLELAIDDFGTGYSSLSYLRQFPIDRLKIDQSFMRNALNNADDASIARTIVALGHALNLKVIAEGVETKEHETFLIEEGCDEAQGYRYAKPMPAEEVIEFFKAYSNDLSSFDNM